MAGWCWRAPQLTGLSHQGIINSVRDLLNLGLILVKKGPRNSRTPNQYALNLDLTTGQLVQKFGPVQKLTSATSPKFRPVLVQKLDSLKINPIKINTIRLVLTRLHIMSVVNSPKIRSKPTRRPPDPAEPEAFTPGTSLPPP